MSTIIHYLLFLVYFFSIHPSFTNAKFGSKISVQVSNKGECSTLVTINARMLYHGANSSRKMIDFEKERKRDIYKALNKKFGEG